MMRPACPKCNPGFLVRIDYPFIPGYEVKCMLCGWQTVKAPRVTMPLTKQMLDKSRQADMERRPCKVVGCPNEIYPLFNTSNLCRQCHTAKKSYEKTSQRQPPPFLLVGGLLYRNPDSTVRGIKHVTLVAL